MDTLNISLLCVIICHYYCYYVIPKRWPQSVLIDGIGNMQCYDVKTMKISSMIFCIHVTVNHAHVSACVFVLGNSSN